MNGKVQNPTKEDIQNAIKETVNSFTNLKDLNDFLTKLHASDAYTVIRDIVQPKNNIIVAQAKSNDVIEYQRFQDLSREAKQVFEYERKTATMFDVHKISTSTAQKYYGIAVRMISTLDDELAKIKQAINTIEGHIGMSVTDFSRGENNNDTTESGNEQGSKEVIK